MDFIERMYEGDRIIRKSSKIHGILVNSQEFILGTTLLGFGIIACSPADRQKRLRDGAILSGAALGMSLAILAGDTYLKHHTRKELDKLMSSPDDDEDEDPDEDGFCFPWEERPTVTPDGEIAEAPTSDAAPEGGWHRPDPEPETEVPTGEPATETPDPTEGTTVDAPEEG